jgi:hypothetical protein
LVYRNYFLTSIYTCSPYVIPDIRIYLVPGTKPFGIVPKPCLV